MTSAIEKLANPVQPRIVDASDRPVGIIAADVTINDLRLNGKRVSADVLDVLVDATIEQTIRGASTLELQLASGAKQLVRSGLFGTAKLAGGAVTATVDGLEWRLRGLERGEDDSFTSTYEDEVVAALRGIRQRRVAPRSKVTRFEFMRARVAEVRPRIPFVCPELNVVRPIGSAAQRKSSKAKAAARDYGFAKGDKIRVHGKTATREQRANLERVLEVGVKMNAPRTVLLAALVTVTVESLAKNLKGGDADSVGMFQQRASQGWPASRNIEQDARAFYTLAMQKYRANHRISVGDLAADVQRPRESLRGRYASWVAEATATLATYQGGSYAAQRDAKYLFTIGPPGGERGEDYWTGLTRLGEEVQAAVFAIAGSVYAMSETRMYAAKPLLTVRDEEEWVERISWSVDAGMRVSEMTLTVRAEQWVVPAGSTVLVEGEGPADGKWLVETFRRSLFSDLAEVSLVQPKPLLPEPVAEDSSGSSSNGAGTGNAVFDNKFRWPTAKKTVTSGFGPRGGRNHDGIDIGIPIGTPVRASAAGKVVSVGAQSGYGNTIEIRHDGAFTTLYAHLDSYDCKQGDTVKAGERIGRSGNTGRSTGPHLHFEIKQSGTPIDPQRYLR